jgi:hypothetical protein
MIPNAATLVAADASEVLANERWSSCGMSEQLDRKYMPLANSRSTNTPAVNQGYHHLLSNFL